MSGGVSDKRHGNTHEVLTLKPVLGFLAARKAGVPARELAAVEGTSEGKCKAVGDACSSSSSWDRLREERVLRPLVAVGVDRTAAGRLVVGGAGVGCGRGGATMAARSGKASLMRSATLGSSSRASLISGA